MALSWKFYHSDYGKKSFDNFWKCSTLISLINVEPTLTNFEKFHPPQKKIPPPRLLISLLKCLILLQNLMTIFLTIILSYKTLFYLKNWCLLPPPHLVIFHFWHPSTFIPGSTFIREMRVGDNFGILKDQPLKKKCNHFVIQHYRYFLPFNLNLHNQIDINMYAAF